MKNLYIFRISIIASLTCVVAMGQHQQQRLVAIEDATRICKNKLNFSSKIDLMHGFGKIDGYSRNSGCAYVCGRKTFRWDNGPQGFGDGVKPGTTTEWSSCLNMAATFDPILAKQWGTAMGKEFWGKGTNIQEGPGMNVARIMRNGRNFEYISGEDPRLGQVMVVPVIEGIQENVMAIAKHYINNNQETDRNGVNEVVDEKTIMELYAPPFASAVSIAAGVMCSYNRINGDWACENQETLKTMLKGHFDFKGFVVSDWGATYHDDFTTKKAVVNGLDIEMPMEKRFTEETIQNGLNAKNFTMDQIDDKCIRILSSYFMIPEDRRLPCNGGICIDVNVSTNEHKQLARKITAMSTVLLKNSKNYLPLNFTEVMEKQLKILFVGPDATTGCYTHGSGSGSVVTNDVICPLEAFSNFFGDNFSKANIMYVDGSNVHDTIMKAGLADVVFVFGSAATGEGKDRENLSLDGNIDELIPKVAIVNKNTVVVLTTGGSILTPWREEVSVILTNFFPGEQVGPALFDIIFGNIVPQAKLPLTFPNIENEQKMSIDQYPGIKTKEFNLQANYSEGQIVGYRYYDKHGIKPAFEFGFGLSYGSYEYSNLQIQGRKISFKVSLMEQSRKDSSIVPCDTPQIYFGFPDAKSKYDVPNKILRYFKKVCSDDGEVTIEYEFNDNDVSNWNVQKQEWEVTSGSYTVYVGRSSKDIQLTGEVIV